LKKTGGIKVKTNWWTNCSKIFDDVNRALQQINIILMAVELRISISWCQYNKGNNNDE
jgi:hypothetical protein